MIQALSEEVAAIGIFDALTSNNITKVAKKLVEHSSIDVEYSTLKAQLISDLIELNKVANEKKEKVNCSNRSTILVAFREQALKQNKHPYEVLEKNNFIKNPIVEFYS